MGKETKVGLLVGMCFIVCCAIVLSHHGRRRAEAQNLSVTNAERSREAPLLLDRNASAERATKRNTSKGTPRRNKRSAPARTQIEDEPETRLADSRNNTDYRSESIDHGSQTRRNGFEPRDNREANARPSDTVTAPFIHRGPPIPDVVAPKTSLMNRRVEDDRIVLDDGSGDSDPLVANIPNGDRRNPSDQFLLADERAASNRRTLTSTPSPAPTDYRESGTSRSNTARSETDAIESLERLENLRLEEDSKRTTGRQTKTAMDRHLVQDGENLSRIAEQYYGSSAPKILDAIVKANHETMSGPNHIVSGRELLIPEIPGIESIRREESSDLAASNANRDVDTGRSSRSDDDIESNSRATTQSNIFAEYEVQPGDQLSRVVSRHYGSASKQIIDQVFEANRDRMNSPDGLVAGTVIVLPELEGVRPKQLGAKRNQRTEPIANNAKNAKTKESFRWYVVQKGDTYSTIAAAEMGTSKRWNELAEFNKSVFKNAKLIRPGVKIRIPNSTSSGNKTDSNRRGR